MPSQKLQWKLFQRFQIHRLTHLFWSVTRVAKTRWRIIWVLSHYGLSIWNFTKILFKWNWYKYDAQSGQLQPIKDNSLFTFTGTILLVLHGGQHIPSWISKIVERINMTILRVFSVLLIIIWNHLRLIRTCHQLSLPYRPIFPFKQVRTTGSKSEVMLK